MAGQNEERRCVYDHHRVRDATRQFFYESGDRAVIDHTWADEHRLHALGKPGNFLGSNGRDVAAFSFGQREDASFGNFRRDELCDAAGRSYSELPCPCSERGSRREYHRAGHLSRAAYDKHATALFFIAFFVGLRQRPSVEQAGGQGARLCGSLSWSGHLLFYVIYESHFDVGIKDS